MAGRRWPPGRHPGSGHRPPGLRRAGNDERGRTGDPRATARTCVSSASGPRSGQVSGASGSSCSGTAPGACRRSGPSRRAPSGSSSSRSGAARNRTRAHPKSGCGWLDCGMPSVSRPRVAAPSSGRGRSMTVRVTVWSESRQDRTDAAVQAVYPDGIHGAIAPACASTTASRSGPRPWTTRIRASSDAVLAETDVLTWWGHVAHDEVSDAAVDRVHARVLDGMGLIVLHSGHFSKIFKRLMGTSCDLNGARMPVASGCGWSIRRTRSPRASVNRSSWPRRRCTANTSTSHRPTSWSS